jgi:hypothetical protein
MKLWMPFLTIPLGLGVWILAETAVYGLISARIGGLLTFLLFVLKPVAGFLFLGQMLKRKFRSLAAKANGGMVIGSLNGAGLAVLGAILMVVPGFLAGLVGLALLTPSVLGRWGGRGPDAGDRASRPMSPKEVDLEAGDWREIETPKLPRKRKPRSPDE